MTGQDNIIKVRRKGYSPELVRIEDHAVRYPDASTVVMTPVDVPELQDWRFTVGLTVIVTSFETERAARISASCAAFAKRVITNTLAMKPNHWGHHVAMVDRIEDTQGLMKWPI
jgi:hypothetical protein